MKKVSIVETIKREVAKGNTFVTKDGKFTTINDSDVKVAYGKGIASGDVDISNSFDAFKKEYVGQYIDTDIIIERLSQLGIDFDDPEEVKEGDGEVAES